MPDTSLISTERLLNTMGRPELGLRRQGGKFLWKPRQLCFILWIRLFSFVISRNALKTKGVFGVFAEKTIGRGRLEKGSGETRRYWETKNMGSSFKKARTLGWVRGVGGWQKEAAVWDVVQRSSRSRRKLWGPPKPGPFPLICPLETKNGSVQ